MPYRLATPQQMKKACQDKLWAPILLLGKECVNDKLNYFVNLSLLFVVASIKYTHSKNKLMPMPIVVCGINHKTASVSLREKVVFPPDKLAFYLQDLLENENISEAVLLSTCNRSELYCNIDQIEKAVSWFTRNQALPSHELEPLMYLYQDEKAVQHIMEVACGLDSMVLGEPQILGQMKEAFSESCAAGTVDTVFNRLFQQVFAVAKEVRSTTAIGACPVSVSSATVHFVKQIYPANIENAIILLIGAGATMDLVLRYLNPTSCRQIQIINRSEENALELAKKHNCETLHFSKLNESLYHADIVISATGSAVPLVNKSMLEKRNKPVFIVDIAVPRDVDPAVNDLAYVNLFSIDDLKEIIQQNKRGREHAAEKAAEVIEQRSKDFFAWLNSFQMVATTIRAYRKQIETLCEVEIKKFTRLLREGADPESILISFANAFTQKLLHTPSVQLRQAGFEGRLEVLQLVQELFAIPGPELV